MNNTTSWESEKYELFHSQLMYSRPTYFLQKYEFFGSSLFSTSNSGFFSNSNKFSILYLWSNVKILLYQNKNTNQNCFLDKAGKILLSTWTVHVVWRSWIHNGKYFWRKNRSKNRFIMRLKRSKRLWAKWKKLLWLKWKKSPLKLPLRRKQKNCLNPM